jgi:hypothetical protein
MAVLCAATLRDLGLSPADIRGELDKPNMAALTFKGTVSA